MSDVAVCEAYISMELDVTIVHNYSLCESLLAVSGVASSVRARVQSVCTVSYTHLTLPTILRV